MCSVFLRLSTLTPHKCFFRNTAPFKSAGIGESENFFLSILHSFCVIREYAESIKHIQYVANLGLLAVHKIVSEKAERFSAYMEKTQRYTKLRITR
jgi:hypothetical protein